MTTAGSPSSRRTVAKILDAAEKVFAERGYAGARMEQIVARSGVAKSHLYYHFASKQQIFDDLVDQRIGEILAEKDAMLRELTPQLRPESLPELSRELVRRLFVPRADFLRIVLVESLGTGGAGGVSLLQRIVAPLLTDSAARFAELGYDIDRDRLVTDGFFFGIVPAAVQIALGDRWAAATGVDPARAEELFLRRLVDLAHHVTDRLPRRDPRPS